MINRRYAGRYAGQKLSMRDGRYLQSTWGRGRNTMTYSSRALGATSFTVITALLVLVVGLIYVAQSTKSTSYDYDVALIEKKIDDLKAYREELVVERARLTSIAAAEKSAVAASMETAKPAGRAS